MIHSFNWYRFVGIPRLMSWLRKTWKILHRPLCASFLLDHHWTYSDGWSGTSKRCSRCDKFQWVHRNRTFRVKV